MRSPAWHLVPWAERPSVWVSGTGPIRRKSSYRESYNLQPFSTNRFLLYSVWGKPANTPTRVLLFRAKTEARGPNGAKLRKVFVRVFSPSQCVSATSSPHRPLLFLCYSLSVLHSSMSSLQVWNCQPTVNGRTCRAPRFRKTDFHTSLSFLGGLFSVDNFLWKLNLAFVVY